MKIDEHDRRNDRQNVQYKDHEQYGNAWREKRVNRSGDDYESTCISSDD